MSLPDYSLESYPAYAAKHNPGLKAVDLPLPDSIRQAHNVLNRDAIKKAVLESNPDLKVIEYVIKKRPRPSV